MKKLVGICLALVLLLTAVPAMAESGEVMAVIKTNVHLRAAANSNAKKVVKAPYGAAVMCLADVGDYCYVSYAGKTGYVKTDALYDRGDALVVKCNQYVSLRSEPSTSAKRISKIFKGHTALFLGVAENGFYKVSYGGDTGYVLSKYLYSAGEFEETIGRKLRAAESLTLRTAEGEKVITVPQNTVLTDYGIDVNGMAYVEYCDNFGFVSGNRMYMDDMVGSKGFTKATLKVKLNGKTRTQTITNKKRLSELYKLLENEAEIANDFGKCPKNGLLTLYTKDGQQLQFARATDGCGGFQSKDGRIYNLSQGDSRKFWDIFDDAWEWIN